MELRVLAAVALTAILFTEANGTKKGDDGNYESLYLSPYIKAGQIDVARNLSRVKLFEHHIGAETHSGYITIDSWKKSNLFFLHIRALKNPDAYPLLLWLQGGPGLSSLFGEFLEIGPLGIDGKGCLFKRQGSLQRHVNVVYLDQPVGAGYSFTKGLLGYAKDLNDVSSGVLEFLDQFVTMFPEYRNRTFYVGGESYGARFTVAVSHAILKGKEPRVPLRLRGVILGAGFLGRLMKVADSSEFLYEMSPGHQRGPQESRRELRRHEAKGENADRQAGRAAATQEDHLHVGEDAHRVPEAHGLQQPGQRAVLREAPQHGPVREVRAERRVQASRARRSRRSVYGSRGQGVDEPEERLPDRHQPRNRGPAQILQGALLHGSNGHALPVAEPTGVLPVPKVARCHGVPEGRAAALEGVSLISFRIRSRHPSAKHDRRGALPGGTLHGR
uniref:Putative serine carboxypeptidase lysosomal cathepsin a n=1 Tax=Rhipicephalus microplus TaxID=6941 RepID=A0A6G5A907_RHIMP